MTQDEAKKLAAQAALKYVTPDSVLGVGTGSTVNHFIDLLAAQGPRISAAVSSSEASTARMRAHGMHVVDLAEAGRLALYVDGADEANPALQLIKGGGAALTREKIVASAADQFICIADASKYVEVLGKFPLPIEVIEMAIAPVSAAIQALGGNPVLRPGVITDNGHPIIDVHGLSITDPLALETTLSLLPGVVTVGLFAHRPANLLILGGSEGICELRCSA